jgi:DNA-binding NarL/FixJ family response regulator
MKMQNEKPILIFTKSDITFLGMNQILNGIVNNSIIHSKLYTIDIIKKNQPVFIIVEINSKEEFSFFKNFIDKNHEFSKVIFFVDNQLGFNVNETINLGVAGIISKSDSKDENITAFSNIISGKSFISPVFTNQMLEFIKVISSKEINKFQEFNVQEVLTLALITMGYKNKEIADFLKLSPGYIKNVNSSIYQKLHIGNRSGAAAIAIKFNLFANYNIEEMLTARGININQQS